MIQWNIKIANVNIYKTLAFSSNVLLVVSGVVVKGSVYRADHARMHEWMNELMNEWMDGWIDG